MSSLMIQLQGRMRFGSKWQSRADQGVNATFVIVEMGHFGIVHTRINTYKLVLAHLEQQGEGLDKVNIAAASIGDADGDGEETRGVLFPLIQANKQWQLMQQLILGKQGSNLSHMVQ